MKKSTKILSVFLALVMVFSCVPMTAFAADRDTSSLDAYLDNDNLAVLVETLLTDLDARSEVLIPTVLKLVFMLDQLKDKAEEANVDVATATTEDLADVLIAYVDEVLEEAELDKDIADYAGIIKSATGLKVDLSSVDSILQLLLDAGDVLKNPPSIATLVGIKDFGEAANLDVSMFEYKSGTAISTSNTDSVKIIDALFTFLGNSSNIAIIKSVVKGTLDLGSANEAIDSLASFNIEEEVNGLMSNLDKTVNELLYDNLVATWVEVENEDGTTSKEIETPYEESDYYEFSSDELLAAALVKLITGEDIDQSKAKKVAGMTLNELIGEYGDYIIASFALDWLNNDLKDMIKELIESDDQLAVLNNIINLEYEFAVEDFNLTSLAKSGIFEGLNDLVCGIIEVVVQPAVAKELALKTGGNENITANLTSFFGYVLKTLAGNNGGKLEFTIDDVAYSFDFSEFTADALADMDLEDMLVEVVGIFYPTLLGVSVPEDVDSLDELLLYTAYYAIDAYMVKPSECAFTTDYSELVFNEDGTVKTLEEAEWVDTIGTMAMEVAVYWLDKATDFGMSQEQVAAFKEAGWTWEDFLEDIVDWALNYVKGIPAVADELDFERGVEDGYGPWYKLNVVFNELIALNFINDCGDETFVVDTYTLCIGKVVPSLLACDFAAFADVLAKNSDKESIFNQTVISGVLGLVDNLLFSLFEHNCGETATFTKEATETHDGYTGTYCKANGHYVEVTVIPALGTDKGPEYTLGDVNADGKINASDARTVLRSSAKLETLDEVQMLAADVNKDEKVNASDARIILRVSAKLQTLE